MPIDKSDVTEQNSMSRGRQQGEPARSTHGPPAEQSDVHLLPISSIRKDGETQHRVAPDPNVIAMAERQCILRRALEHPNSAKISDAQLVGYLHLPRTTLHRWRRELSWPSEQDSVGTVTPCGTAYTLAATNTGKSCGARRATFHRNLPGELAEMKKEASGSAGDLLNIIQRWAVGQANSGSSSSHEINALVLPRCHDSLT
jgi:hypothetical protein